VPWQEDPAFDIGAVPLPGHGAAERLHRCGQPFMSIDGDTQDLGDHREWLRPGERGHQVDRPGGRQRVEKRVRVRHDPLPVPFDAARREQAREVRANSAMPLRRKPGQESRSPNNSSINARSAASTPLSCPDATMSRSLPRTITHPLKP
jgi:hypothetical protein